LIEIALTVAAALIFLGILSAIIRLVIGPSGVDRVAAIDLMSIITISLIALYAHLSGRFIYLDVALIYGLLSFLAVLAIARYLERGL
jgi:multicomponent Na+:H+ antiporter subunit F